MTLDWVRSATPSNPLSARIDTNNSNTNSNTDKKDGTSPQAVIASAQGTQPTSINNNTNANPNNFNLNLNLNRPAANTPPNAYPPLPNTTASTESQTPNNNPTISTTNLPTSLGLALPQHQHQQSQNDPLPLSLALPPAAKSNLSNVSNISNVSAVAGVSNISNVANTPSQALPLPSISTHNRPQSLPQQHHLNLPITPISGPAASNTSSFNIGGSGGGGLLAPVSTNSVQLSPTSGGLPTSMPLQAFHHTLNPSHSTSNPLPISNPLGGAALQPPIHSLQQQPTPSNSHNNVNISGSGNGNRHQQPPQSIPSQTPPEAQNTYSGMNTMNSIPGLHSVNVNVSQPNMLHGLPMPFPGSGWENSFGYGAMPSLHSLMPNSRLDSIGHVGHHTPIPSAASLGPSLGGTPLGSSHPFPNVGLLSGGITKPRKHRRRSDLSASIKGEDAHSLLMGLPPTKYDASILLAPQTPTQNLPEADGVQFKYLHQLPEAKVRRLRDEKIKPIEELTFDDIKAYNRNQLRAYCFVYGIKRKKKAEMEKNMAKYAALFHPGDMAYDIKNFEPTKYIEGAIPRRKIPVTKEQKERAAGNTQELTKVINRRPQVSPYPGYHATAAHTYPFGTPTPTTRYPPPHRNGTDDVHVANSEFFEDIYTIP